LPCRAREHPCPKTVPRHRDDADGLQRESTTHRTRSTNPPAARRRGDQGAASVSCDRWTPRALHFRQALVRQLRRGEWRLLLLASVSSSVVRRRGLKIANRANLGLRWFSVNGRAIGFFAAVRLRSCRTCNKKVLDFGLRNATRRQCPRTAMPSLPRPHASCLSRVRCSGLASRDTTSHYQVPSM
jgi:hypothetical protein